MSNIKKNSSVKSTRARTRFKVNSEPHQDVTTKSLAEDIFKSYKMDNPNDVTIRTVQGWMRFEFAERIRKLEESSKKAKAPDRVRIMDGIRNTMYYLLGGDIAVRDDNLMGEINAWSRELAISHDFAYSIKSHGKSKTKNQKPWSPEKPKEDVQMDDVEEDKQDVEMDDVEEEKLPSKEDVQMDDVEEEKLPSKEDVQMDDVEEENEPSQKVKHKRKRPDFFEPEPENKKHKTEETKELEEKLPPKEDVQMDDVEEEEEPPKEEPPKEEPPKEEPPKEEPPKEEPPKEEPSQKVNHKRVRPDFFEPEPKNKKQREKEPPEELDDYDDLSVYDSEESNEDSKVKLKEDQLDAQAKREEAFFESETTPSTTSPAQAPAQDPPVAEESTHHQSELQPESESTAAEDMNHQSSVDSNAENPMGTAPEAPGPLVVDDDIHQGGTIGKVNS